MVRGLKIYCTGFEFVSSHVGNDFYKMSFLNKNFTEANGKLVRLNTNVGTNGRLLLNEEGYSFILKKSLKDLTYEIEEISSDSDRISAFFVSSDISFQVSNIRPIKNTTGTDPVSMRDFFKVLYDTTYIKYKFEIEYNGVLRYVGSVDKEYLGEQLTGSGSSNKVVTLRVFGWETELNDYYSGLQLPNMEDAGGGFLVSETNYKVAFQNVGYAPIPVRYVSVQGFLPALFEYGVEFELEQSIAERHWRIYEMAHFIKFDVGHMIFIKCGYYHAKMQGDSVYSFFIKLLLAMGWVFFAYVDSTGTFKIGIKNRKSLDLPEKNLSDYKFVKNPPKKLAKGVSYSHIKHIVIGAGDIYGGAECVLMFKNTRLRGSRSIVITKYGVEALSPNHLDWVTINQGVGGYSHAFFRAYCQTIANEEKEFIYRKVNSIAHNNSLVYSQGRLNKRDMILLDAGHNTEVKMKVDSATGRNDFGSSDQADVTATQMMFSGNYGEMLGYVDESKPLADRDKYIYHWHDYVRGIKPGGTETTFIDNYKSLMRKLDDLAPEVTIKDLDFNPMVRPKFTNDEHYNDEVFNLNELVIDLEKGYQTYKLTR